MDYEKRLQIAKEDLNEDISTDWFLISKVEKAKEEFLHVKMSLVGILGIILTIVFNNPENFELKVNINFISLLLFVFICIILLLIDDLYVNFNNRARERKKQMERMVLDNIRHSSIILEGDDKEEKTLKDKFKRYAEEAENRLNNEHALTKDIKENLSIDDIIKKVTKPIRWKLDFFLWSVLLILIPILFILKILGALK